MTTTAKMENGATVRINGKTFTVVHTEPAGHMVHLCGARGGEAHLIQNRNTKSWSLLTSRGMRTGTAPVQSFDVISSAVDA